MVKLYNPFEDMKIRENEGIIIIDFNLCKECGNVYYFAIN